MDKQTKTNGLQALWSTSHLAGNNAPYLEQLFEDYLANPESVDQQWRTYFQNLPRTNGAAEDVSHAYIRDDFRKLAKAGRPLQTSNDATTASINQAGKQIQVLQLINAYRIRGHQQADFDPLKIDPQEEIPELDPAYHGLTDADLDTVFDTGSLFGKKQTTLKEILAILNRTYRSSLGAEYMHITETQEKRWIQSRLEGSHSTPDLAPEIKLRILDRLIAAEGLERFLHTKYVGQKRFSLEGAESLIPLLDELIQHGGNEGLNEIVIGMAHRGRLNVLINIMGKTPEELFMEFEGKNKINGNGTGDVKYHMGFSSNIKSKNGPVHVAMAFNPSHLEIVGPVVEGSVRARQERRKDLQGSQVIPILIHGDAAFAGQGVVMETLNMSQSRGYSTKGTVHIIINNQIGFTTSNQRDARSTLYCTDVAKMVNAPVFHVNGDDPEAVVFIAKLALDYRMTFRKDVVIDMVCYRRHGHSEADEPFSSQPIMYQRIKEKQTTMTLYSQRLIGESAVSETEFQTMRNDYRDALEKGEHVIANLIRNDEVCYSYDAAWRPYMQNACDVAIKTSVGESTIKKLVNRISQLPDGFVLHPNVAKIMDNRRKMAAGALPIDWGFAETMAYATIVNDGYNIRLSGQDSGRGTFFHRHAVLHSQSDGEVFVPLRTIDHKHANFLVINSLLSEEAVLAFEYGYSTTDPNTLVIWEAQFGDFANNAQVVIDQFISAGEQKWDRLSGLVMLLPHGYEGQGPEHSSARLERYLQLCAQHNMQVCAPTSPDQIFHLLRRQVLMTCRKPLIVMTPKSLLRHKLAVCTPEDLINGQFMMVIPEIDDLDNQQVKRIILCSGKVFYDLLEKRRQDERQDVAIIRIEQLYPFPNDILQAELDKYPQATDLIWCQEEPMNQGAWYPNQHHLQLLLNEKLNNISYAGRPHLAAPAVGNIALHIKQLHEFIDQALGNVS